LEADKLVDDATAALIRRCKNNDENAYNQLLSLYEGYLYRLCFNYTRNKEEALDMIQEVYIKVFRSLHYFDETRPFLPWLKKIAINTLINNSRKNRIDETPLQSESFLQDNTNTEDLVVSNDTRNIINNLIAELPESYRLALTLRYYENLNYEEIASELEQPLGTVKNSVHRARNILRKKMQACELLEV
jgi:RNA polymerase sigma-70 factor (ECF subfamily)